MNVEIYFPSNISHEGGTRCVKNKAKPKKNQMPDLKSTGEPLTPDTDRVEN